MPRSIKSERITPSDETVVIVVSSAVGLAIWHLLDKLITINAVIEYGDVVPLKL